MVSDPHGCTGTLVATLVPLGTAEVHEAKPQTQGLGEVQLWVQAGPHNPRPTFAVSQEHAASEAIDAGTCRLLCGLVQHRGVTPSQ